MTEIENTFQTSAPVKNTVSILDETLSTGGHGPYKLLCTIEPEFISIAAVDAAKNKFAGLEGFHFSKPLSEDQMVQKISGLALESTILKKIDFRSASVQFSNSRFTFMPSAIFKQEDAAAYFNFNHGKRDGESIHYNSVTGFNAINIFAVPERLLLAVKRLFEKFTVHHQLSALLEAARLNPQKAGGKRVFIHMHPSSMDVIVAEDMKLLLVNSFPYKVIDDAVYFVMMVFSQLGLSAEQVPAILSGEIEKHAPLAGQLQKYIRHISFGERIKAAAFTYGFDTLPPHFFHGAFSHILCES